jgi:hypothetical protein
MTEKTWLTKGLRHERRNVLREGQKKTEKTWLTKGLRPLSGIFWLGLWILRRKRPDLRRDCDGWRVTTKLIIRNPRRKRPDLRRDCDVNSSIHNASFVVWDGKDLTYEGIATCRFRAGLIGVSDFADGKDHLRRDCDSNNNHRIRTSTACDGKGLTYKGLRHWLTSHNIILFSSDGKTWLTRGLRRNWTECIMPQTATEKTTYEGIATDDV